MTDETHAHEIVIIKRHGGGHEDAHHGGVWKIAFADFMTAMMAFFLVMWLISANDKTKATIAKYFNPVELVDSTPQPPGLNDSKEGAPSVQRETKKTSPGAEGKDSADQAQAPAQGQAPTPAAAPGQAQAQPQPPATAEAKTKSGSDGADRPVAEAAATAAHDEAELTRDPYAVLAELASKGNREAPEKTNLPPIQDAERGVGSQGAQGGEAFRDPFQPAEAPPAEAMAGGGAPGEATGAGPSGQTTAPAVPGATSPTPAAPGGGVPSEPAVAQAAGEDKPVPASVLRSKLAALARSADGSPVAGAPKLDVRQTAEGLLISLTDSADFAMFPSASARPAAKMVAMVEKVGQLLKAQKGGITVRGFTDSRPFRSDTYDNWRLSTARAHMAHYMLVQGGVSDSRIDRIEGYADRRPKNVKTPDAPENRRIEILLRDNTP